ncbi:MAG: antibiotic biosynthesis monooxygenase [Acidimicrobiia bacterium]|nr:antibiotic biosynthesis monooxygenase [Acidimicrobiia bacterium]
MLIIAGTISVDPDHRSRFLDEVAPMVAASRAEDGCQAYVFSADPTDTDLIRLYELWDSEDALAAHFASDHMAEWRERSAKLPVTARDIAKYTVSTVSPLD